MLHPPEHQQAKKMAGKTEKRVLNRLGESDGAARIVVPGACGRKSRDSFVEFQMSCGIGVTFIGVGNRRCERNFRA